MSDVNWVPSGASAKRGLFASDMPKTYTSDRVWWMRPAWLLSLVVLPAFITSSLLGGPIMHFYGALNFLTPGFILIGVACLLSTVLGVKMGELFSTSKSFSHQEVDALRAERAILALAAISIICHIIFLASAFARPGLVLQALSGQTWAAYAIKRGLNKIPGVTSFMSLYLMALPLYGAFPHLFKTRPSRTTRICVYVLLGLIFLRAFIGFERFSLIEAAVCFALPRVAFARKIGPLTTLGPIGGGVGVIALFATGEFFRTWGHYKYIFSSFPEFVTIRLLGYLCTSANNAAGIMDTNGPLYAPYFTGTWLQKLPLWDLVGNPFHVESPLSLFFAKYGNAEFNNPSGIYAAVLDYGVVLGLIVMLFVGCVGGILYGLFKRARPAGILLFPLWFLGFLVLTQAFYWSDPRVFPVFLIFPLTLVYIRNPRKSALRNKKAGHAL